jgi:hypothetical protein
MDRLTGTAPAASTLAMSRSTSELEPDGTTTQNGLGGWLCPTVFPVPGRVDYWLSYTQTKENICTPARASVTTWWPPFVACSPGNARDAGGYSPPHTYLAEVKSSPIWLVASL